MTWQTLKIATRHMDALQKENEALKASIKRIIQRYENSSNSGEEDSIKETAPCKSSTEVCSSEKNIEKQILSALANLIAEKA